MRTCYYLNMGGWGSGRQGGRPTADASLRIDLAWMLRTGRAEEGRIVSGTLGWTCRGQPSGTIAYKALMHEPGEERLELFFVRGSGERREEVRQTIRMCHTRPNYGGKRWWMVCPYRGIRAGKLYLPSGGDRFASRQAWRLGYHSQRIASRDRPFEARSGFRAAWDALKAGSIQYAVPRACGTAPMPGWSNAIGNWTSNAPSIWPA